MGGGRVVVALLAARRVAGEISHEDAQCIMRGKTMAFFGDSITRYCYFGFNYWLETGEVPSEEYDSSFGDNDEDYDRNRVTTPWTDWYISDMSNGKWRQRFAKVFDDLDDAYTEFYFIQDAYYDSDDTDGETSVADLASTVKGYDYIAYNTGIWNLKEKNDLTSDYCGEDWTDECEEHWEDMFDDLEDEMWSDGATVVWRATTCCGEADDGEWIPSIEEQNSYAKSFMENNDHSYVDAYSLFDEDDKDDFLFDDTHPNVDTCLTINKMILEAIDVANGSPCTVGATPTYAPTKRPSSEPSAEPTYVPTFEPSFEPTPRPTEGSTCFDDTTWYKSGDTDKDCTWVASFVPTRCAVRGEDGRDAYQACQESCDACDEGSCEDSTSWTLSSDDTKDCAWVEEFYRNRCTRQSDDGAYAFEACPYACRTCSKCEDSTSWSIETDASKNCAWVAESSTLRCTKYGLEDGETTLGFLSCRDACQVCEGETGTCEDSTTWYKNGEPSKDCDWVAGFAPAPRCTVVGADGDAAYKHCLVSCGTC
ncbi:hypothetical protein CTAYLR_000243 [Chrysophaeum taylorii]|uniref:Uncharacterized protein n=1 Tax=Chrysophaeum taylorii TaxID=2483200 RepID=A0AAD7UEN2_9STRA|nr:hypothetical protein CTAYLR_000243 [Chrysophaeum taylorii]